ncbi:hypothetical protein ABBQ32_005483 [Trebouxia sp. C0010 RCD-2024]
MQARLLLRASFRSSVHPTCVKGAAETRLQQQPATVRQASSQASNAFGTGGGSQSSSNRKQFILYPAAAVIALTSVAAAKAHQQPLLDEEHQHSSLLDAQWVQRIPQQQNVLQVLSAKSLDTHPLLTKDHIFTAFLRNGQLKDMVCFYDTAEKKYYTVLQLGREVCGFPTIVHGGFTATVMDETLGFLLFALKKQQALPFWGPAYTAHLEVEYKAKISAGSVVLCTAEIESMEGRKLWMKSTVKDGPTGKVYATARALFVAPSSTRLAKDAVRLLRDGVFPPDKMASSM